VDAAQVAGAVINQSNHQRTIPRGRRAGKEESRTPGTLEGPRVGAALGRKYPAHPREHPVPPGARRVPYEPARLGLRLNPLKGFLRRLGMLSLNGLRDLLHRDFSLGPHAGVREQRQS